MLFRFNEKLFFIFFIILFITGCTEKKEKLPGDSKLIFSSNLDCFDCWQNLNSLKPGIAHSGQYSSKLDSVTEFSYAFSQQYKYVKANNVKKINAKIWCYFPTSDVKAQFVISIDSASKSIQWESLKIEDKVKVASVWTEVSFSATLPKNISDENLLKIYVWNPLRKTFYIDDLEVSFD